jgi:recombination protein RecA
MQNLSSKVNTLKLPSIKSDLESALANRFGSAIKLREKPLLKSAPTGVDEVDSITGGLPRGALSEFVGSVSSGRTSLMLATLAAATSRGEACALVDTTDSFDPVSGAAAGIDMDRLLWIRCAGNGEHALKAVDLLLQGGGFGLVILDLGDISPRDARRIQPTWWFRFRRAIENKPTVMLLIGQESCARSCASLVLEVQKEATAWSSPESTDSHQSIPLSSTLLRGFQLRIERNKPITPGERRTRIKARAL